MKVLLFGAKGQVGLECAAQFIATGFELIALTRDQVDLTQAETVANAIVARRPDLVVNAAAYTAVDKAESEPELADQINHLAVAAMAEACALVNAPLFHLSTDYVFDGTKTAAYVETDAVNPQGVYGASKLAGEQAVARLLPQHMILRTAWVFGRQGNNFVHTMLRLGKERDTLGVVADQRGGPTYAGDIAAALVALAKRLKEAGDLPWGLYHYSGAPACSWHEFASTIFAEAVAAGRLARAPQVNAIGTADYPTPAQRPASSVLDSTRLVEGGWGVAACDWRLRLRQMLA
mgnify:CR=1 FL=1